VTILKGILSSISQRKALVKQYVMLTEQRDQKQRDLEDPKNSYSNAAKIQLNE
jgi:hypothetical protein